MNTQLRHLQNENARLKNENWELRDELHKLRQAFLAVSELQEKSEEITPEMDVLVLMDHIMKAAIDSVGASDGSLMLVDEESNELAFVVVHGVARDALTGHRIPIGTGIAGWVAQRGENVIVPNVNLDPRFSHTIDKSFRFRTHSLLCVPIIHEGRTLGVIQAINKVDGKEFNDFDLTLLVVVARLAGAAINRAEVFFADDVEEA